MTNISTANTAKKLNESFILLETNDLKIKQTIKDRFSVPIKNAKYDPLIQAGIKDEYERFYRVNPNNNNQIMLPIGLSSFVRDLCQVPEEQPEYSEYEVIKHIDKVKNFDPYDYQQNAVVGAIQNKKHFIRAATGSGKSFIIGLIVDFLISKGLKGLILVPNILLVNQFYSDLNDYKLDCYFKTHLIGGEFKEKNFDKPLTISTYQSVMRFKESLSQLDFIIVDEAHMAKASEVFDIVSKCINAKYKIGLSGTLPEDPADRMKILCCFGKPKTYITTQGLIDRGLATPVSINVININYNTSLKGDYHAQLKFLKEYDPRNKLIINLTNSLKGNTLVLFQHTVHGYYLMYELFRSRGIQIQQKDITGKNALVMQTQHKIYFINGSIEGKNRETIRNILDTQTDAVIIANYSTMSTGANIKNLHNMVFASPLKSYVTVTQSIGRGLRLHKSKQVFKLYDLADNIGIFKSQLNHRIKTSYEPEGFQVNIKSITI